MKLFAYNSLWALALLFLVACGGKTAENGETADKPADKPMSCTYAYTKDSTRVAFTAYKFTEKVGVSGKFDEFTVNLDDQAKTADSLISSVEFRIPISSFNTNKPERDEKIKTIFFGALTDTDEITGKVKSVSGSTATVGVLMNDVEKDVEMEYSFKDGVVSMSAVLQLADWNALPAVDAINKACEELHKGTDGESKLWPEVKVVIKSTLVKNCEEM